MLVSTTDAHMIHGEDQRSTNIPQPYSTCHLELQPSLTEHHQSAGGEALPGVVEGLARVGSGVLGEDLGYLQTVQIPGAVVLKVLGRLYLLVVVQPDDVELGWA